MRNRLLGLAVLLIAGAAAAQQPVPAVPMPAPGTPPPPAALAGQPPVALPPTAGPIVVPAQPGCGTPAPCADCGSAKPKHSLLGKAFIGSGTASPVGCSCFAAERTFLFGGCNQFFTPGKTCFGGAKEYGCGSGECGGGFGHRDNCKHITSFLNR